MEIKVFSQERFTAFIHNNKDTLNTEELCVIRISNGNFLETDLDDVFFSDEFENQIAFFSFADVEDEFFEANKEAFLEAEKRTDIRQSPITIEEAKKIKEFIEANKDKKLLLIHCEAGECRSWTTAFCIAKHILKNESLAADIRKKVIRFSKTIERRFLEI